MKPKIIIVLLAFLLSISAAACLNNKSSTNLNNSSSPSNNKTSNTGIPTNNSTISPSASPIASAKPEYLAIEAYKAVMQNKVDFFSTDDKKYVYLNELLKDGVGDGYPYKLTRFTILDMDGDQIPEVVLELSITGKYPDFYEVLHYMNGTVYGYNFVLRALEQLKIDGTFISSSGAADNSCNKMRFSTNGYEYDILGYSKSEAGPSTKISYFINKPVTEESFSSFIDKQVKKKDVEWYEFSQKNIEAELSINK